MHKAKVGTIKPNSVYSWRGRWPQRGVARRPQLKSQLNLMTRGVGERRQGNAKRKQFVIQCKHWEKRLSYLMRSRYTGSGMTYATRRSRGQQQAQGDPFRVTASRLEETKAENYNETENRKQNSRTDKVLLYSQACFPALTGCANVLLLTHLHSADIVVAPLNLMNMAKCSSPFV